ncbi:MAG: zinc-binding dehydrogenase [Dehalococcoidia bacterium]
MKTTAAVLVALGAPLEIAELSVAELKPGQVWVEIAYSGVCHTQLLEAGGHRGEDRFLPHCLGHEGSGVVVEIGPNVTKVRPGDQVVLSWIKGTGGDVPGCVYQWDGRAVNAGGITTFGHHAVISENRLTPLPAGVSLREAALLGCAAATGFGAVFNTARPSPGQALAVFGAGGVGLCAVQGAAIAGCAPVVAVDVLPAKLDLARQMGATHVVDASQEDPLEALRRLIPGGLDFAIEASGQPSVMDQALRAVRQQGGAAVVIGNARFGERVPLDPQQLNQGKRLLGTWGGDTQPDRDLPRLGRLIAAGRLTLAPLLGREYALAEVNEALDDLASGRTARPLLALAPA